MERDFGYYYRMIQATRSLVALCVLCGLTVCAAAYRPQRRIVLHNSRHAPSDLEIGGSLQGVPPGDTRFVSYQQLLALPQESYTIGDDPNFGRPITISGIALEELPALLGAQPGAAMVIAIADDHYAAHYPASYLRAHHPLLVLKVNGQDPAHWPLGVDRVPMGPYMVSHPGFKPAFQVLSHPDEAQVPWGVVRIDLRREQVVYAPIKPQGAAAKDPAVQQGYTIARQNCFRCHSRRGEGGTKSTIHWGDLTRKAATDPKYFDTYVRTPKLINAHTQMAGNPEYDAATLHALRRYFATFAEASR